MEKRENFVPDPGNLTIDSGIVQGSSNVPNVGSHNLDIFKPSDPVDPSPSVPSSPSSPSSPDSSKYPDKLPGFTDEEYRAYLIVSANLDKFIELASASWYPADQRAKFANMLDIYNRYRQAMIDNIVNPDNSLSPEENISNLQDFLTSLLSGNVNTSLTSGSGYVDLLVQVRSYLQRFLSLQGLGSAAATQLVEKVADVANNYIQTIFSQTLQYQSWYLQQEYNTPINQLNRLSAAGLSSAFVFSGGIGNASSPAGGGGSSMPLVSNSNAGQVQQLEDSSRRSFISSILSTGAQAVPALISGGATAILSVAQAAAIKATTPAQIANLEASTKASAAVADYHYSNAEALKAGLIQNGVLNAGQEVGYYADKFNNDFDRYSEELTVQTAKTFVRTKDGSRIEKSYDMDEADFILTHNGKDREGNTVISEDDMRAYAEFMVQHKVGAKAGMPFGSVSGEVSGGFKAGLDYAKKNSNENVKERITETGSSNGSKHTSYGYDENANTFSIGKTKFKMEESRKRVPQAEYKQYLIDSYNEYRKALDKYNSLSEGYQAHTAKLLDLLIKNYGKYAASKVSSSYSDSLRSLINPEAKVFVGD